MMNQVIGLFNGQNQVPATVLAIASFVLGMIAMCLICKLFCPCGKKTSCKTAKGAKPQPPKQPKEEKFERTHPAPADGSIEIYVGNLSYEMTEEMLNKEFSAFGKVNSARIITNKYNGKSKGFGFVHMPVRAEADAAIKALNDKEVLGRNLKCNEAKNVG